MIQAVVEMVLAPDKLEEGLSILKSVAQRTRAEPGCLRCSVYRDTENDQVIVYDEIWRGEDELKQHLAREEYQKVLLVMETACRPPEIRFNTIQGTAGVEIIERVRAVDSRPAASKEEHE